MALTVKTNNQRRPVVDAWDLTPAEREEFDYIDWPAIERGEDSASFVRAYGQVFDLGDVMRAEGEIRELGWDGFNSDSFFSGMAFKWGTDDSGEYVIVARVYAD